MTPRVRFTFAAMLVLAPIGAGAQVIFPPRVLYSTPEGIGVSYRTGGILHSAREEEAYRLIREHCNGRFRIMGRAAAAEGVMTIDAACTK